MLKKLFTFLVLTLWSTILFALPTIYVNSNNQGITDGSAQNPFRTIQEAINESDHGQKIFIQPGTYRENLSIRNKAVYLEGSSNRSVILNAPFISPAISLYYSEGGSISNMTITHEAGIGDGIRFYHSSGHVDKNIFRDNQTALNIEYKSAGIYVENNLFRNNHIGINSDDSYFKIQNNLFYYHSGPAIQIENDSLVNINNNLIIYNHNYGIKIKKATAHISNNTIAYNQYGLEIELFYRNKVDVLNNIIAFNKSYGFNASIIEIENLKNEYNNLYKNGTNYVGIEKSKNATNFDPDFYSPYSRAAYGFRLGENSLCRNHGTKSPFQKDRDFSRNDQGFTGGPDARWK